MSIQSEYERTRTADRSTNTPDTHQLAAELGVDAALLREFVDHHPAPTVAIVLGWANRSVDAEPDRYAADVERWLDDYRRRHRPPDLDPVTLADLPIERPLPRGWEK